MSLYRCTRLAVTLFDGHRTAPTFVRHPDGTIDEAAQITPAQFAAMFTSKQRSFYMTPARHRATPVTRRTFG